MEDEKGIVRLQFSLRQRLRRLSYLVLGLQGRHYPPPPPSAFDAEEGPPGNMAAAGTRNNASPLGLHLHTINTCDLPWRAGEDGAIV